MLSPNFPVVYRVSRYKRNRTEYTIQLIYDDIKHNKTRQWKTHNVTGKTHLCQHNIDKQTFIQNLALA